MKTKTLVRLLGICAAVVLSSCSTVSVKQIAGDQPVPELKEKLCKGSWRAADGTIATFRMKDEATGLLEIDTREKDGTRKKANLAVRTLGERMVATFWEDGKKPGDEPMVFGRMAIAEDHLSIFLPDVVVFLDAVKKQTIAGQIKQEKAPVEAEKQTTKPESAILEKFGLAEAEKVGGVLKCFDADPGVVLLRESREEAPERKSGKSGRTKK